MSNVLPEEIQRRAQAIGLSVVELCGRAGGLSHTTFYRWLSGTRPLHQHYLAVIAALEAAEAEKHEDAAQ